MSTSQFRAMLLLAAKLKFHESLSLLLNHISPFDFFAIFDKTNSCAWDYINKYQDKDYNTLAKLLLNKIKEYIGDKSATLLSMAIIFGMDRFALNLLKSDKIKYSNDDIKIAFHNAINYREYDVVGFIISKYAKLYQSAFNIDLNEFYVYLCDEINSMNTFADLQKLREKAQTVYKNIFSLDNKSTFFNSQNALWQQCLESLNSRAVILKEKFSEVDIIQARPIGKLSSIKSH